MVGKSFFSETLSKLNIQTIAQINAMQYVKCNAINVMLLL